MENECIFCKVAKGEMPSEKVYEDENVFAFLDINPRNPGHTLVIPKKHYATLMDMPNDEANKLFFIVKKLSSNIKEAVKADGISISQSNGRAAGQIIPHVHFHIIPRFNTEGPPGLETVLPVKKMDKNMLDQISSSIKDVLSESTKSGAVSTSKNDEFDF